VSRRSGLGRGIGALIPTDLVNESHGDLRELPISSVVPNRFQPRAEFDEETLASLADSVRELGVLQPILVRPTDGDRYELIAGERRWRAARQAGLGVIPAIVRRLEDDTSLEQALVENIHREDLSVLEEAAAYQQLIEEFGLTQDEVAKRVGRSRSAVANTVRLLQLPPRIQRLVRERKLSAGHARALLGTPDRAFQEAVANRVVAEGLTVRDVEETIRRRAELESHLGGGQPPSAPAAEPIAPPVPTERNAPETSGASAPAGLLELEHLLGDFLDTSVSVSLTRSRGRISIDFADLEDLERIYRLMTTSGAEISRQSHLEE